MNKAHLPRFLLVLTVLTAGRALAGVTVSVPAEAAPRVAFGASRLREAVREAGLADAGPDVTITLGRADTPPIARLLRTARARGAEPPANPAADAPLAAEGFVVASLPEGGLVVAGGDDSGVLYGALELAQRIQSAGTLPPELHVADAPVLRLRGPCIGMQKTFILPGRKVYEYPYTPELFPFFYDKAFWTEYLDFLVEQRMNTLYLWNGHPFASLVRLADYPYALEVPEDVFARNVEMFRYITQEADKRGIWLVQMFYNIILSKPFAERHGLETQLDAIHPIAADYTRKSIAEFVRQYPNVGLLVCLGEALQDIPQQRDWCTDVILAGVKDGMRAAGLTEEPPVVIRAHATDESVVMPAALQVYRNLYTMAKFNGESLTTWEPRGVWQERHRAMSQLGSAHVVNVHILANLEPFRYGATRFIQRSVQATRDRLGASGLHLYPLTYWNWPYSPDVAPEPLRQIDRDWIWFEAWARYAWNPDVEPAADRAYWIERLAARYGDRTAAAAILDAYNDAGECAPRILRRFGITEGNRQTMALGMTLEQLVDPARARPYPELWLSQAPPGERLQEYVEREFRGEPHAGETPPQIVAEILEFSARAVQAIEAAAPRVTRQREEFARLRNDVHCIRALAEHYAEKVRAAERVLRHRLSGDAADLAAAERHLAASVEHFRTLARLTETTYHFANSMQTSQRRIPVRGGVDGQPANFHWRDLLPVYEEELAEFRGRVARETPGAAAPEPDAGAARLRPVELRVLSPDAAAFPLAIGARVFTDRPETIASLGPAVRDLRGIRFSGETVEFAADQPVRVLVAFPREPVPGWRRPPELETDALAAERGGTEPLLLDALEIAGVGAFDVYALRYPAGRHRLELRGSGRFLLLGGVADVTTE